MSERDDEPAVNRVFRAAIPGRLTGLSRTSDVPSVLAPGRGWLELAVVLAAVALRFPLSGLAAAAASICAGRRGNGRWVAALVMSVWCSVFGSYLFGALSLP